MGSLEDVQGNWEKFAQSDPMWAALMDPEKRGGRWRRKDFFATGEREISTVLNHLAAIGVEPDWKGEALDFGCGVGRLTQALAGRFASATGLDISPTMIELAREAAERPNSDYVLNETGDLGAFESGRFAFVYSSVVLQHMDPALSTGYLSEFARVLAEGGIAVFQIPDRLERGGTAAERLRHATQRLRSKVGLRTRLRGGPVAEMHCVPEERVRATLEEAGARVADVQLTNSTDLDFIGGLEYLSTPPTAGFVSKQYVAVK